MSKATEPGPADQAAQPGAAAQTAHRPAHRGRPGLLHPFRRRDRKAVGDGGHHARHRREGPRGNGRHDRGDHLPEGLAASLVTSGSLLLAMVEDVRMREANQPEDLRALADTFARHNAAKEATVLKVLDRHHTAGQVVERDRQEGTLLQDILDRALMGRHPGDTHTLTVDGALAQMYQYLYHERRDLVPALERAVPRDESETLSAAFEVIDNA